MATVSGTSVIETDAFTATWELTEADTGRAVSMTEFPDKTVQVTGTFGGGNILIEGSNDGSNWASLHDYAGTALNLTDTSLTLIAENPAQLRPRATAGAGMSVTIRIIGV